MAHDALTGQFDRRRFLGTAGAGLATVGAGGLLAACGGGSGKSGGTAIAKKLGGALNV